MKNFVHKITCVLAMCAATVAFTACSDSDNKGDGRLPVPSVWKPAP